jgi:hypothetical protein
MRVVGHQSRTAMWWWISLVRGGSVGWLWWSGKSTTPREASPRWVGAPGPAEEEGGGWLGLAAVSESRKQGRKWWHPYRPTAKPATRTKCKEGGVLLYPHGQRMDETTKMAERVHERWDSSALRRGGARTHAADRSEGASGNGLT